MPGTGTNPLPPPQGQHSNGTPWWVKIFREPTTLATVIAFGAALILFYQVVVVWPKEVDRFDTRMTEIRDITRDNQVLMKAQQKQLDRIEKDSTDMRAWQQGVNKTLQEMWFKLDKNSKDRDEE